MIKVIASDMDGTLLDNKHQIAPETIEAVQRACDAGIRFMVATGRNFRGAMDGLRGAGLICDYIVGSGAEVRSPSKEVICKVPIGMELCEMVYQKLKKYPISVLFCTEHYDYRIGDEAEIEKSFLHQFRLFHMNEDIDEEQAKADTLYKRVRANTKIIPEFGQLRDTKTLVYKIFLYSGDIPMLERIQAELGKNPQLAVAASFKTNLEITDVRAQKGPILKKYIESLGYTMDEVMVLGDSMNDHSMLSMDFGATVAMENSIPSIKEVAKYVTKSNEEHGVAHAINIVLETYYK